MIEQLPQELFYHIATRFLSSADIAKLSCASKTLNRWCGNDIWKVLFFKMQSKDKDCYTITNKSKHDNNYSCICYYECKRYKDSHNGGNYTYGEWLDDGRPCIIPNHYDRNTLVTISGKYDNRPYKNYKKRIATLYRTKLSRTPLELQDETMQRKMREIITSQENLGKMTRQYIRLLHAKVKLKKRLASLHYYIGREQALRKRKRPTNQVSVVV